MLPARSPGSHKLLNFGKGFAIGFAIGFAEIPSKGLVVGSVKNQGLLEAGDVVEADLKFDPQDYSEV